MAANPEAKKIRREALAASRGETTPARLFRGCESNRNREAVDSLVRDVEDVTELGQVREVRFDACDLTGGSPDRIFDRTQTKVHLIWVSHRVGQSR